MRMEIRLTLSYILFIGALIGSSREEWTPPGDLLELCPYTAFCEKNIPKQFSSDYSAEYTPCCRSCSCSETCGLYKNCCRRELDRYTEKVQTEGVCHSTFDPNVSRTSLLPDVHYKMIDKCPGKFQGVENTYWCENFRNFNSTFHPVYSASKNLTYVSKQCAECNDVTDGIEWQMTVNCISDSTFYDEAEKLILGKASVTEDCFLNYIPPEGLDLTSAKCEPDIIRTCNFTGIVSEQDESWALCSEFNATYIIVKTGTLTLRYANIFCWMCNTRREVNKTLNIQFACPTRAVGEEESKHMTGMSMTVILDMMKKKPQALQQRIVGQCLANEVFVTSFQKSCRPRRCPVGQIMLNNKCDFYSSQWYGGPFSFLLKLTPLNGKFIPMEFFSNMPVGIRSSKTAIWLDRSFLKTWYVLPLIQGTDDQTAVKYMVTEVSYPYSSVNPLYLRTEIKKALKETWMLTYNGVEFRMKVALNEFLYYDSTESYHLHVKDIYINQPYIYIPVYSQYNGFPNIVFEYLFSLYSIPAKRFHTGVFLSQLFFCEQIDLLPEEYDFSFGSIFFKVTNKTIYDASYREVQIDSFKNDSLLIKRFTVRVCIDEFLDPHNGSRALSCLITWSSNFMLFVLLYHRVL